MRSCGAEYEQGAYLYFDFTCGVDAEGRVHGWCQRSRPELLFEYAYLSDD